MGRLGPATRRGRRAGAPDAPEGATRSDVAHLLRRAGFGGTPEEISMFVGRGSWEAAVDAVLDTSANPPDTIPAAVDSLEDQGWGAQVAGQTYWLDRMATTPTPIVEKITLMWHGHFTSGTEKVL